MSPSRSLTLDYELPEVETVRRDLEREIVGRKVKAAEAASMKCLRRYHTRKAFTSQLEGAKIVDVRRVGLASRDRAQHGDAAGAVPGLVGLAPSQCQQAPPGSTAPRS